MAKKKKQSKAAGTKRADSATKRATLEERIRQNPVYVILALVGGLIGACLALANQALDVHDKTSTGPDPPSESEVAGVDAEQFRTSYKLLRDPCGTQHGAVGWDAMESSAVGAPIAEFEDLETDLKFAEYSMIELGFSLPRTADNTTIEVTDIGVEVTDGPTEPPAWAAYFEGCGGSEYTAAFRVTIEDGTPTIERVNQHGEPVGDRRFHPFMVRAGEFVHHDYLIVACDRANYDVRLKVAYRSDQGKVGTSYIPDSGTMTFSSLTPETAYAPGLEKLEPVDASSFSPWPPEGCNG